MMKSKKLNLEQGIIVTYVLIFGTVFLLMLAGLLGYILMQLRQSSQKVAWNEALNIAEAGVDYYRWCINNEVEADCTGEKNYYNGAGDLAGTFTVSENVNLSCGQTASRQIISVGRTAKFPNIERGVRILYGRESVAKYSYIINSSVWVGADHEINGPFHSNGGIRMDGQNQSLITSAAVRNEAGEWVCTDSFGCDPCPVSSGCYLSGWQCVCPSVFTTTANPDIGLFEYPEPPFSFDAITMDLADIKEKAKTGGGLYFPASDDLKPGSKGYRLNFKSDGTIEIWTVMALQQTYAYSDEEEWHHDRFIINNEILYATYAIPLDCSAIYVEDNLWVTGTVKGKVVVASAHLKEDGDTEPDIDTDVILPESITYSNYGGDDGLAIIAERNVLIGPQSPGDMELHAIIVAQKGRFGRNHYPNNFKNTLNIYGSVVSRERVGTQWVSYGQMVSGYAQRYTYVDQNQVYNPPPFIAGMSSNFKIVNWEEMK